MGKSLIERAFEQSVLIAVRQAARDVIKKTKDSLADKTKSRKRKSIKRYDRDEEDDLSSDT